MLYLEIDFDSTEEESGQSGRFMVLVEADDTESGREKIQQTILEGRKAGLYPGKAEFSTAHILVIEKIPEPGLLAFYEYSPDDPPGPGMICSPRPVLRLSDQVKSFHFAAEWDPDRPMVEPFFLLDSDD